MANFDGTGPRGFGPMTGRGRGRCAGAVGYFRRGFGRGFGFAQPNEKTDLIRYKEDLEYELESVKTELEKLEKAS